MPKDPNARVQKAIAKKEKDIKGWAIFKSEALRAGDKKLAAVFDQRIKEAERAILELQTKLK